MGPKPTVPSSGDLYRSRLDQILDPRHELVRLAGLIDWDRFDQEFGRFYRPLGRPAKPTRLMVGCRISSTPSTCPMGDVTLTANTTLYSSREKLALREINDLGCAKTDLVGQPNGYTQLM